MSYDTVQAAVYQLVIASTFYTAANAKEEDWTVLDAPGVDIAVCIWMAGDSQEADEVEDHGEYGMKQAIHEVGITVAAKIKTGRDAVAINTLREAVAALSAYIRPRPRLNAAAGVNDAQIVRITRRMGINRTREMNSATHWASTIVVRVWEEFAVTYVEQGG